MAPFTCPWGHPYSQGGLLSTLGWAGLLVDSVAGGLEAVTA